MIWSTSKQTIRAVEQFADVQHTQFYHQQLSAVDIEPAQFFLLNDNARRTNPKRMVIPFVELSAQGVPVTPKSLFGVQSPSARSGKYTSEVSSLLYESHSLSERLALRGIFTRGMRMSAETSIAKSLDTLDQGRIAYVPERLNHLGVLYDDVDLYEKGDISGEQKDFLKQEIGIAYSSLFEYLRPAQQRDIDVRSDLLV
jgi:hypothetical protein